MNQEMNKRQFDVASRLGAISIEANLSPEEFIEMLEIVLEISKHSLEHTNEVYPLPNE